MAGKAGKNPLLHDCKRLFHYAGAVYIIGSVDNHFVGIEQAHKVCKADAQVFCAVVYGAEGFPIARFREAREGFELLKRLAALAGVQLEHSRGRTHGLQTAMVAAGARVAIPGDGGVADFANDLRNANAILNERRSPCPERCR